MYSFKVAEFIKNYYKDISVWLRIAVCVMTFMNVKIFLDDAVTDNYLRVKREITLRLEGVMHSYDKKNIFSYDYVKKKLDAFGVTYYTKGKITPLGYLIYKAAAVVIAITTGIIYKMWIGIIILLILWYFPEIYFVRKNKKDEKRMLESLMAMYDVLFLQINSGEYITHILIDMYRVVSYPRIKSALLEMTGDIFATNNLEMALGIFLGKFHDENIKDFVILIHHVVDQESNIEMIADIKKHLKKIRHSYSKYERDKAERIGNGCAIAMFVLIAVTMAYVSMIGLSDAARIFVMKQ